jgi:DNA gyrase subunit A
MFDNQEYRESHNIVFCTKQGVIKKTLLDDYKNVRSKGIIALSLREGDAVVSVCLTNGENEIVVANRGGRAIRFSESTVRTMGRGATGVKAMAIDSEEDEIVGMVCVEDPETQSILVVSEQGYGKRSTVEDYRITNRGSMGVKNYEVTEKTGKVVGVKVVDGSEDLMLVTQSGTIIRTDVNAIRIAGRATQGVIVMRFKEENDQVIGMALAEKEEA